MNPSLMGRGLLVNRTDDRMGYEARNEQIVTQAVFVLANVGVGRSLDFCSVN